MASFEKWLRRAHSLVFKLRREILIATTAVLIVASTILLFRSSKMPRSEKNVLAQEIFHQNQSESLNTPSLSPSPAESSDIKDDEPKISKADFIKREFLECWNNYRRKAWGHDYFRPRSGEFYDDIGIGVLAHEFSTTLMIMNETAELNQMKSLYDNLSLANGSISTNFFISSIIGSLLSLSQYLNDTLYSSFARRLWSRYPEANSEEIYVFSRLSPVNLEKTFAFIYKGAVEISTHSLGGIQMEMLTLFKMINDISLIPRSLVMFNRLFSESDRKGLIPDNILGYTSAAITGSGYSLEENGSSIYQNIADLHIFTKNGLPSLVKHANNFFEALTDHFVIIRHNGQLFLKRSAEGPNEMSYRTAFIPSLLLALADINDNDGNRSSSKRLAVRQRDLASQLMDSFIQVEENSKYLPPMLMKLDNPNSLVEVLDGTFYFAPEYFRSLYSFWKATNNSKYTDAAWRLFRKFIKYCKTEHGLSDVQLQNDGSITILDSVNPLLFSATFKYLYLMFSNETILSDEWILNSHGHPLKIWDQQLEGLDNLAFGQNPAQNDMFGFA